MERDRLEKVREENSKKGGGAKWSTYHSEVPLQAEEDLVLPHGRELGHILEEQQSLLHHVGHIAGYPSLEVPDGGTGWRWSPIQH